MSGCVADSVQACNVALTAQLGIPPSSGDNTILAALTATIRKVLVHSRLLHVSRPGEEARRTGKSGGPWRSAQSVLLPTN